jgi:hypothetical protein
MGVFTHVVDLSENGRFNGGKIADNEVIWVCGVVATKNLIKRNGVQSTWPR